MTVLCVTFVPQEYRASIILMCLIWNYSSTSLQRTWTLACVSAKFDFEVNALLYILWYLLFKIQVYICHRYIHPAFTFANHTNRRRRIMLPVSLLYQTYPDDIFSPLSLAVSPPCLSVHPFSLSSYSPEPNTQRSSKS